VLTQLMAISGYRKGLADRRYATSLCAGCAVLVECDQAAGEARHEVGCLGWP
jgi:hypothetical protein